MVQWNRRIRFSFPSGIKGRIRLLICRATQRKPTAANPLRSMDATSIHCSVVIFSF